MDKNQEYWNILNSTQDAIKYSDTKATIILTLFSVILTVVYSNAEQVLIALKTSNTVMCFSIFSITFAVLSSLFAFLCINPRLKNNNPKSIIYFGHIQKKFSNFNDYHTKAEDILANDYSSELAEQIYSNSKIAWAKFSNVTWCIRFLFCCITFLSLSLISYLF